MNITKKISDKDLKKKVKTIIDKIVSVNVQIEEKKKEAKNIEEAKE
jgi:hypothetical protein